MAELGQRRHQTCRLRCTVGEQGGSGHRRRGDGARSPHQPDSDSSHFFLEKPVPPSPFEVIGEQDGSHYTITRPLGRVKNTNPEPS